MIRWMLRIALIVGTFFATSWVTFLIIGGFFWDAGSAQELNAREFPTPQDWLDMITYGVGTISAALVAFETKSMTRADRSTGPE